MTFLPRLLIAALIVLPVEGQAGLRERSQLCIENTLSELKASPVFQYFQAKKREKNGPLRDASQALVQKHFSDAPVGLAQSFEFVDEVEQARKFMEAHPELDPTEVADYLFLSLNKTRRPTRRALRLMEEVLTQPEDMSDAAKVMRQWFEENRPKLEAQRKLINESRALVKDYFQGIPRAEDLENIFVDAETIERVRDLLRRGEASGWAKNKDAKESLLQALILAHARPVSARWGMTRTKILDNIENVMKGSQDRAPAEVRNWLNKQVRGWKRERQILHSTLGRFGIKNVDELLATYDQRSLQCRATSRLNANQMAAATQFTLFKGATDTMAAGLAYTYTNWEKEKDQDWWVAMGFDLLQHGVVGLTTGVVAGQPGASTLKKSVHKYLITFLPGIPTNFSYGMSVAPDADKVATHMRPSPHPVREKLDNLAFSDPELSEALSLLDVDPMELKNLSPRVKGIIKDHWSRHMYEENAGPMSVGGHLGLGTGVALGVDRTLFYRAWLLNVPLELKMSEKISQLFCVFGKKAIPMAAAVNIAYISIHNILMYPARHWAVGI